MGREKHRPKPKQKACQGGGAVSQGKAKAGMPPGVAERRNVHAGKATGVDARPRLIYKYLK
jgi:hypothetical protein